MQDITVNGVMGLLPNSAEQINSFVSQLVASVKGGNENALKLKAQFKFLEKVMEKVEAEIKEEVLTEAMKYGGKPFEAFGFKIEVSENLGVKYDYSVCNDPHWNDLDRMEKAIARDKKAREKWLQAIKFDLEIVDPETGETSNIKQPIKSSTTGLKFTSI